MYKRPFFMLLVEKYPKHKRNKYFFISESFALNWYIFVTLTNKKLLLLIYCRLKKNRLFDLKKLIEYWASAIKVVLSDPCVGPLPIIKIPLYLLSIYADELISAPEIITFLPTLVSSNENESNTMTSICVFICISIFNWLKTPKYAIL